MDNYSFVMLSCFFLFIIGVLSALQRDNSDVNRGIAILIASLFATISFAILLFKLGVKL